VARGVSSYDDVTDRRLRLLVGLVVVLGLAAMAWAVAEAWTDPTPLKQPELLLQLVVAIAIGNRTSLWIRVGSHMRGISWPEVGVLAGLSLVSPGWVILCTAVAITISKLTARTPPQKAVFGVAKEVLVACTASGIFLGMHLHPNAGKPELRLGALALAAVAMWIVDEALVVPVLAFATRRNLREVLHENWDMRVLGLAARYVVTVLVIGILRYATPYMLLVVAPVVLCIHLWQTAQIRSRQERESWHQLAQSTDELNGVDLRAVLH
jgi:diguanylate cyclase